MVKELNDKLVGVKMPQRLADQLEAIAHREANGVSAVVRRLVTAGLQREHELRGEAS